MSNYNFDKLNKQFKKVEFELGSGDFDFICNQALLKIDTLFIGTEIQGQFLNQEIQFKSKALANLELISDDGIEVLKSLKNNSINTIHIYYPSPKRSWHYEWKDVLSMENFETYYEKLKTNGVLRIITDHNNYYLTALRNMTKNKFWICDWESIIGINEEYYVDTVCEKRYSKNGRINVLFGRKY